LKVFLAVFITIFLAELGDKTQLATMLFAADRQANKWVVFIAASSALIVASALGVLLGAVIAKYLGEKSLRVVAGIGFIAIGTWILLSK